MTVPGHPEQRGTVLQSMAARCECVLSATCPHLQVDVVLWVIQQVVQDPVAHGLVLPAQVRAAGPSIHTHPRTGRPTSMPCGASRQPKKCPECMADTRNAAHGSPPCALLSTMRLRAVQSGHALSVRLARSASLCGSRPAPRARRGPRMHVAWHGLHP